VESLEFRLYSPDEKWLFLTNKFRSWNDKNLPVCFLQPRPVFSNNMHCLTSRLCCLVKADRCKSSCKNVREKSISLNDLTPCPDVQIPIRDQKSQDQQLEPETQTLLSTAATNDVRSQAQVSLSDALSSCLDGYVETPATGHSTRSAVGVPPERFGTLNSASKVSTSSRVS